MDVLAYALAKKYAKEGLAKKADLVNGKIPADELPSYVDDIVEYASRSEFPTTGEIGKIYVADDTGFTYRWSGSEYVQVNARDSVLEFASLSAFPQTGASETIYVALDTNRLYRWDETTSAYVQVSESLDVYEVKLSDVVEFVSANTFYITEELYNKAVSNKYIFRLDASLFNPRFSGLITYYPVTNLQGNINFVLYASTLVLDGLAFSYFHIQQIDDKYVAGLTLFTYKDIYIEGGQLVIDDLNVQSRYYLPKINGVQLEFSDSYSYDSLDINDIEVVEYQTTHQLTDEQVAKAQVGKLAVHYLNSSYNQVLLPVNKSGSTVTFRSLTSIGANTPVSANFPSSKEVTILEIPLNTTTRMLGATSWVVKNFAEDVSANVFSSDATPALNGKRIARGLNLAKTQSMLASNFDETQTYAVGDYVIYLNDLYRCVSAVNVAGPYYPADWALVDVGEELKTKQNVLSMATNIEVNRLFETEYAITANITNGSASGDESIWTKETAEVTIVPSSGYDLPETITVSGATYSYDSSTGVVSLSAATGNVTITATCSPTPPMPAKGDIITLDGGTARYRVLGVSESEALLLAMDDYANSVYGTGMTKTFDSGKTGQQYAGSTLDTLLNETYYDSLSSNVKSAIVDQTIIQRMYSFKYPDNPSYDYHQQNSFDATDMIGLQIEDQTTVGSRHVFALDIKDIFDYLGKDTMTSAELNEMFFEQTTAVNKFVWLSSAHSDISNYVFLVYGSSGYVNYSLYNRSYVARPAFKVNISQVSWVKE